MEIRDPIHGFIEYDEIEEKIINTKVFQRLRNIKQLALANYVYPGALHTRFDHSIGVMHLAGKIAKIFYPDKKDESKVKTIRLAGLLHDIGHGPFSHVSEQLLDDITKNLDKLKEEYKAENAHELMSILIIKNNNEINDILDDETIYNIIKLIQKSQEGFLDKDIVSGPLDADKLDYLLRDSYFCGVTYGVFDKDKLIESMVKIPLSTKENSIGINEEGIYSLEQFLLAYYHMKMQVYYHRVRRIADAMLIRGINYAIKENVNGIKKLFTIEDNPEFLDKYVKYNDFLIVNELKQRGNITKYYFERLNNRNLFKEIHALELTKEELGVDGVGFVNIFLKIKNINEIGLLKISESISSLLQKKYGLNIKAELIIIDIQTFTNPTFKSPGIKIDTKTISVLTKDGNREEFNELSVVFKNPSIEPERNWLYVYAPIDELNRDVKENLKKELTSHIKSILLNILRG